MLNIFETSSQVSSRRSIEPVTVHSTRRVSRSAVMISISSEYRAALSQLFHRSRNELRRSGVRNVISIDTETFPSAGGRKYGKVTRNTLISRGCKSMPFIELSIQSRSSSLVRSFSASSFAYQFQQYRTGLMAVKIITAQAGQMNSRDVLKGDGRHRPSLRPRPRWARLLPAICTFFFPFHIQLSLKKTPPSEGCVQNFSAKNDHFLSLGRFLSPPGPLRSATDGITTADIFVLLNVHFCRVIRYQPLYPLSLSLSLSCSILFPLPIFFFHSAWRIFLKGLLCACVRARACACVSLTFHSFLDKGGKVGKRWLFRILDARRTDAVMPSGYG